MKIEGDNPTINDVARLAGVSKRTVSRVLNDSPKVNDKTRKEIKRIMKELKYAPSPQARGLASSRSYLIGLLYDDPNALFIHAIQRGILSVCVKAGYEMVVHPCNHRSRTLVAGVNQFIRRSKIDGVVILPPLSANDRLASALAEEGVHYVRLAARPVDEAEHLVVSNDRAVMVELAEHFASLGHQRIGFITGPRHRLATGERLEGFSAGLERFGLRMDKQNIFEGDFTYESGIRCGHELLARPRPVTAVFASNDEMAAGVIHAAWERGLRIPDDLSIAGYDDSPLASKIVPPLTTFRRRDEAMAAQAVRKLLASIAGRVDEAVSMDSVFEPHLITRQSTGPCGK